MKIDSIFQIGKSSLSPAQVEAIRSALQARELIKVSVLKNCADDPAELAEVIAQRTGSQVVQVIGKKIVLYKKNAKREAKKIPDGKLKKRSSGLGEGKGTGRAAGKGTARAAEKRTGRVGDARRDRSRGSERSRRSRTARHG